MTARAAARVAAVSVMPFPTRQPGPRRAVFFCRNLDMLSLSAAHVHLTLAILAEVVATSSLKASDGLSRPLPTAIVVIGYATAFYFLSLALRSVPVGLAYAIWSGAGIVLVSLAGWALFGQKIDLAGAIGIALILAGVLVLNLFSRAGH